MKECIYIAIAIAFVCTMVYACSYKQLDTYKKTHTNIYGDKLESCKESGMNRGSWMSDGTCSETGGGVHQICIKNIANNATGFSKKTGQSDWSDKRGTHHHCVCLGAWSLYAHKHKNKIKQNILKCESIPRIALSKNYVSKFSEGWNKWNGLEIDDQIKHGVNELMNQCYDETSNDKKHKQLKKHYCKFAKDVHALKQSETYKKLCN